MKIIFAQGNPGPEYQDTRHNVGFLCVDYYANHKNFQFQYKSKFFADIAELSLDGQKVLFVKPTTFYNETGKSARALVDFYKAETTDIFVIHDELALPFGTLRTREKGRDAGNNGIKSLNAHLGESYTRLRIGTNNELLERMGSFDFVLSKFSSEESSKLTSDVFPKASSLIDEFIAGTHRSVSHSV